MPRPSMAVPDSELKSLLSGFAAKFSTTVITGRSLESILGFLGPSYSYVAMHGAVYYHNGIVEELIGSVQEYSALTAEIVSSSGTMLEHFPGLLISDKKGGVLYHYGSMDHALLPELAKAVESAGRKAGMEVYRGKNVLELRIPGVNKGTAIRKIRNGKPAMIAGDDATDEEAFSANMDALTIHVGNSGTAAKFRLLDYREMRYLMQLMIDQV